MMPILNHTPHIEKQTIEPVVTSHATNIVLRVNYRSVKPQNGPTPHEHVVQSPHVALGMVIPVLAHLSTPVIKNYLIVGIVSPYGQLDFAFWVLIPLEPHLLQICHNR
jgi:hypothetical protein